MLVKHYVTTEDSLNTKTFEEGSLYVTEDTHRVYIDPVGGTNRILISADPIVLNSEADRDALLSPINNKLYFVLGSCKMYMYANDDWHAMDTVYKHPSYTNRASGLYKITVDATGHVSGTSAVTKSDITALGIDTDASRYSIKASSGVGKDIATLRYYTTADDTGKYSIAAKTKNDTNAWSLGGKINSSGPDLRFTWYTDEDNGTWGGDTQVITAKNLANGSTPGAVISGGDVTITDGVITVNDNSHNHSNYVPLTGGTMTGQLTFKNTTATPAKGTVLPLIRGQCQNAAGNYYDIVLVDLIAAAEADTTVSSGYARFGSHNGSSFFTSGESGRTLPKVLADAGELSAENTYITSDGSVMIYTGCSNDGATYTKAVSVSSTKFTSFVPLYGAVWNDYAEYRSQKEEIGPGYCVASSDNGQVYKTTERFQACDGIVSDTFGFAIGETDECKTPLAVAGRVLAYCEGDRYSYHAGDTVCAGPDGRVCKMTREEIREWPDRIIGIVSEIPEYETWGSGNVPVDDRIWIKIK